MMKPSTGRIVSIVSFIVSGFITSVIVDVDETPVGVIILLWGIIWFGPVILWQILMANRSQSRKDSIQNLANKYFQNNNMIPADQSRCFDLDTAHSCILVIPATDSNGRQYLTVWDGIKNMRYVMMQGHVRSYHTNVNGQQIDSVGGYFLGFGMMRSHVEAVNSVNTIIYLTNGQYMDICIGNNIVEGEFDATNHFLNRFEATLSMYA